MDMQYICTSNFIYHAKFFWSPNSAEAHDTFNFLDSHILVFCQVWLHKLETDQSNDLCLYHEKDDMFSLDIQASESKQYLFIASESKTTRFLFYLEKLKLESGLMALTPRVSGIDTTASHCGNHFFIKRRSDEFYNSELLACPVDNVTETTILLPHSERSG